LWPSKIGTRRGNVIKDAPLQKTLPDRRRGVRMFVGS
jgi:hypothetical protein